MLSVRTAGFASIGAAGADEAIAILEARADIRLVFTDVQMPGTMDGVKLAHYIRSRWPPIASGRFFRAEKMRQLNTLRAGPDEHGQDG